MRRLFGFWLPVVALGSSLAFGAPPPAQSNGGPERGQPEPAVAVAVVRAAGTDDSANGEPSAFTVHVVDVGTGLGVFVEGPDFTLVYDAGSNDDPAGLNNRFVAYLRKTKPGLVTLDHLVISHPHEDHISMLPGLLKNYGVSQVWDSGAKNGDCSYQDVIRSVAKSDATYHSAMKDSGNHFVIFGKTCGELGIKVKVAHGEQIKTGQEIRLGDNAAMTFMYVAGRTMSDLNANSLVVRLDLGSKRVLLMGDAGAGKRDSAAHAPETGSPESKLVASSASELNSDVLIVGHHGSKTASRRAFLDAVTPEISVISSGPKEYGHVQLPDAEVVDVLQSYGAVFRTDRDDEACLTNPAKIGHDNDGKPGGCDNVRITLSDKHPPTAEYWTEAD